MKDFKGKTAVITGAAHGFGMVIAEECAARGMKLAINDMDGEALAEVAKKLEGMGAQVLTDTSDASVYENVEAFVQNANKTLGSVDLMVNNAGVYFTGTIWDMPARDMQWMMDINTLGVLYGVKAAVPIMRAQGTECHILNVASVAGLIATRSMALYHASKHAVVASSEAIAYDLQSTEGNKIGISIFCPGFIQTDLHNCWKHRPERYQADDAYYESDAYKKNITLVNKFITTGEPIDVVVPNVFKGIEDNQFYISTEDTYKMYTPWMKKRWDNIANKNNPDAKNMG